MNLDSTHFWYVGVFEEVSIFVVQYGMTYHENFSVCNVVLRPPNKESPINDFKQTKFKYS